MTKFQVTLKQLRENQTCVDGYNKLVSSLKGVEFDDGKTSYMRFKHKEKIPLTYIVESNGLQDALWCLKCNSKWNRDSRLFAVWCARQVQHLMEDERSLNALEVAEKYAKQQATDYMLLAAWAAAGDAARDAAWAARAAWAAARAAAWAAARDAARAAARDAARDAQKDMFIKMCNGEAPWQKGEL